MPSKLLGRAQDLLAGWLAWLVPPREPIGSVAWWRDRMLGATLLAYGVFGTILVVPNVALAVRVGVYQVVVVDAAVYALLLGALLARRVSRVTRGWVIIAVNLGLGLFFSWGWGGNAAGPLWLMAAPVLAGIILGVQPAVWTLFAVGVLTVGMDVAVSRGLPPWTQSAIPGVALPSADGQWLIIGSNLMFLATVGALGTAILAWGLARQSDARRRAENELMLIGRALEQSEDVVLLLDDEGRIAHRNRVTDGAADTRDAPYGARTIGALDLTVADGTRAPLPWQAAFRGASWMGR